MFGWVDAERAPAAAAVWDGIGTPGRPVQYSTPVLGVPAGRPGAGVAGGVRDRSSWGSLSGGGVAQKHS